MRVALRRYVFGFLVLIPVATQAQDNVTCEAFLALERSGQLAAIADIATKCHIPEGDMAVS